MPGDDAMTCQQIATELAPYAKQMGGAASPLAQTQKELLARGQARMAQEAPKAAAGTAAAVASTLDPTGASSKALGQAQAVEQHEQFTRALAEDKPLSDQANKQANEFVGQAQQAQSNARVQRLLQLALQKHYH